MACNFFLRPPMPPCHYYDSDIFQIAFEQNGIAYTVQTVERNATSTLDILKSRYFI